jgi:class 3 adenylate cyclase
VLSRWVKRGTGSVHEHTAELLRALVDDDYSIVGRPIDSRWLRLGGDSAAGLAIELAFERQTPALYEGAVEVIDRLRSRGQVFTTTTALFIPRLSAMASSLMRLTDAADQLIAARQQAEALRLHLEVAYCDYALGLHHQRADDIHLARRSLRNARDLAATIGAELLLRRCDVVLDAGHGGFGEGYRSEATQEVAETVIVLFIDIAESTTLTEQLGDWAFRSRSRALERELRASVERNGGSSAFGITLGDGILADFRSARNAAACALECAALAQLAGLPVHIGLHAGDVLREAGTIFGGAVNLAARLCSLSEPSEVLVSQTFRELARTSTRAPFEDKGLHTLKGISEPVRVFAMQHTTAVSSPRHHTPVA